MQIPVDLKKRYLARRIQEIKNLKAELYEGDFTHALKLGHQIKGNAATFEFYEIGPLGKEIEKAAYQKDKEKLKLLVHKVEILIYQADSSLKESETLDVLRE